MLLAHLGGLPLEEVLLPLAYGGTGVWGALRVRFLLRRPRRRRRLPRRAGGCDRASSARILADLISRDPEGPRHEPHR